MKRILAVFLGMMMVVLLLSGCSSGAAIDGTWWGVENPAERISFIRDGSGIYDMVVDDEGLMQTVDFTWKYDARNKEYILTGDREYRVAFAARDDVEMILCNGKQYVKTADRTRMRSEYLAEMSREIAEQSPKEERMAALVEEYAETFRDTVRMEMGQVYPMPDDLGSVKLLKLWKTEGEKPQLHLTLELIGEQNTLELMTTEEGLDIHKPIYDDVGGPGLHLNWFLYGDDTNSNREVVKYGTRDVQVGETCTVDIAWYSNDLESRKLKALEELAAKYGFHDDREAVIAAIEEAGLPAAYAWVRLDPTQYLLDFTEVLEG